MDACVVSVVDWLLLNGRLTDLDPEVEVFDAAPVGIETPPDVCFMVDRK